MRGAIIIIALALLAGACGDNRPVTPGEDASPFDAPTAIDAAPATGPCLDRPDDLPRPPTGALPCELLPPGFGT
jgi:hypothetical protein